MADRDSATYSQLGDLCVAARFVEVLRGQGVVDLDTLLDCQSSARLDKPGLPAWRERFRLELPGEGDGSVVLYVKRYRRPPVGAQRQRVVHGVGRHSTAWIEWQWLHRLAADGVATVTPVAFGERMAGWHELGSVLVTEGAAGESLEHWAARRRCRCSRDWISGLAEFVGRFHRLGYVHRDLYLSHVFVDESASRVGDRFRLIDLQRVIRPKWLRRRWTVKDLAALDYSTPEGVATAADRLRFLKCYLGANASRSVWKSLARRIVRKTRRIARHDRRRLGGAGELAPATGLGGS